MVSISCAFLWCCHDTPGFSIWNSSFRSLEVVIIRFKGHAFWLVRIRFLLFHIAQLVKASRATSFISSNAYLKISFAVCPCLASSHYHCGFEAQTTWTSEQKNKAWEQSSVYDLHLSHNPSGTIFLLHKLALVGRASLEHRQTKFFILLGTSKLHICRHQPAPCEEELLNSGCTLLSSERNLYPDFTAYIPVGVKGHMSLSGWGEELSGMLLIIAASATLKQWSITSLFQLRVCWFINASTEEFCWPKIIWDTTFGWYFVGNQLSPHILICFPSPTLHKAPFKITSLPWRMLLQV